MFYAASWIPHVANGIFQKLRAWGLTSQNLNLVGHSLGALLSAELGQRFNQVNTITALDSPSQSNRAGSEYPNGYTDALDHALYRYDSVSRFSRSFDGRTSIAGNREIGRTAHESYLLDFRFGNPDVFFNEHGRVHRVFRDIITPNNSNNLARGLFNLDDTKII